MLTHKIAIQLHLVAESCTICGSRSRRSVRKFLDTLSYNELEQTESIQYVQLDGVNMWPLQQFFGFQPVF
jgi:hypothetical protein